MSVLKNVEFVVTRKPFSFRKWIAAIASSNTPSFETDSSCRSRRPSTCTVNAKYGEGLKLNLSHRLRTSSAFVQR